MSRDDDDDNDGSEGGEGYVTITQACEQSGFTLPQLRSLVSAGLVRTTRVRGSLAYNSEDLARLAGMPRVAEPDEPSPMVAEFKAVTDGYRAMVELALRQTKQAQDHERLLVAAFSKPLDQLGEGSKALVTAVLEQNKQLVVRATEGDAARLDFVKAAETMLRDQRVELREQAELDRKHELRREVWDGVKKAAPHLLKGIQATTGADKLEAAMKLKERLDPAKIAALIHFKLLGDEEIDLLCTALELDRAAIEALNREANEASEGVDAEVVGKAAE